MKTSIKVVIITGIIVGFAFVLAGIPEQSDAAAPPASVTIDNIQKTKPPVVFPHAAHVARGIKCEDCHEAAAGGGALKLKTMSDFHKNCKDACHKASATAPKMCPDCHKP